jgi:hypothetical protein
MPGPPGPDPPAERLAYCVDEATRLTGLSRDLLDDQMRRGNPSSIKVRQAAAHHPPAPPAVPGRRVLPRRSGSRPQGPPGRSRRPDAGSGYLDHGPRGGHPRAHRSRRPARRWPMARPVPLAAMPWQGRGNQLPVHAPDPDGRSPVPRHSSWRGWRLMACACRSEAGGG